MAAVLPFPASVPFSRPGAPVSALDGGCVAALITTRGEGQVSAMGTLLVFPATLQEFSLDNCNNCDYTSDSL